MADDREIHDTRGARGGYAPRAGSSRLWSGNGCCGMGQRWDLHPRLLVCSACMRFEAVLSPSPSSLLSSLTIAQCSTAYCATDEAQTASPTPSHALSGFIGPVLCGFTPICSDGIYPRLCGNCALSRLGRDPSHTLSPTIDTVANIPRPAVPYCKIERA